MGSPTKDFHHPYRPYDIQMEFMNAVYACIVEGQIGIFESPTGTGKSLSLICSSLTWLRDSQDQSLHCPVTAEEESDEPRWVVEAANTQKRELAIEQRLDLEARLRKIRAKELQRKQHHENEGPRVKRLKVEESGLTSEKDDETQFELDEYNSEDEDKKAKVPPENPHHKGLSSATLQLVESLGLLPHSTSRDQDIVPTDEVKVYFCSRTHSQLTQFVQEVRRVDLPPPSWAAEVEHSPREGRRGQVVKHLPLGSRKNLCINPKVSKLSSVNAINDRCLELQQPDTPKDNKCPFIPNRDNETLVHDFRDHAIAKVRDIEDLGALGERLGVCPYYASRAAIKPAEIITLPYPLLLQKSAREALDISLKGNVVIIDEAHNLMDTISNIYSVSVTLTQLKQCRSKLGIYLQKFRNKLKGKNRVYVAQTVRLIDSLSSCLETMNEGKRASEGIIDSSALMAGKGVDQINVYKLMNYLQESKLARKVEGYVSHADKNKLNASSDSNVKRHSSTLPVLACAQSFFETLINPVTGGRFFYEKHDNDEVSLKYMLLDPSHHFSEVVEDARAVILAGGTMSPMDDYVRHLLAYVNPERLRTFSCGHIIPKENLIALQVAQSRCGRDFDFTYEKRSSPNMIDMLGDCIVELSATVPDGLVVFFPSYAYLDQVVTRWQIKSSNISLNHWDRLQSNKSIFRETKTTGVDELLLQYSQAISNGQGGLLLSVIGGKLSEGINFSDALGRGVVVVGLPFPNIQSAQWKAKLDYIEKTTTDRSGKREDGKAAAREFYENACMRAVNQSIGRAIRHIGDYASIILLDKRYATSRIEGKLPDWIRQGIEKTNGTNSLHGAIARLRLFFGAKKES